MVKKAFVCQYLAPTNICLDIQSARLSNWNRIIQPALQALFKRKQKNIKYVPFNLKHLLGNSDPLEMKP